MTSPLREGQRVEVLWDRQGWLPGTFDMYCSGDVGEDFQRCRVTMDAGYPCRHPGFHPDCVRPAPEVDTQTESLF